MFIINLEYLGLETPEGLQKIDEHLVAHRTFLESYYQKGVLLASGPKNPRVGGILIALGTDRSIIEKMIQEDPFAQHHLASYTITEFSPVKYRPELSELV